MGLWVSKENIFDYHFNRKEMPTVEIIRAKLKDKKAIPNGDLASVSSDPKSILIKPYRKTSA